MEMDVVEVDHAPVDVHAELLAGTLDPGRDVFRVLNQSTSSLGALGFEHDMQALPGRKRPAGFSLATRERATMSSRRLRFRDAGKPDLNLTTRSRCQAPP